MIKLFDTCEILDYCIPKPEPPPEPENKESEWMMADNPQAQGRSWRPWSRRARGTVRAVPTVYPEHLAQDMKRDA